MANLPLVCKIKFSSNFKRHIKFGVSNLSAMTIFMYKLKFLNLHEFGLIKFNLFKAKFLNKISQNLACRFDLILKFKV
ncbi:hypothetical protein UNSW2_57 [Campylobacter concisus UNSW2]|uniref:Uncharacterized protein n=1 Tax=Campylobacter concisus UNSW2 TaxID=1242965 RepID=U2H2L6_9BACT|nr:hypothetical protein UNSW2_57 [Campylobacter concisus UNSW2]